MVFVTPLMVCERLFICRRLYVFSFCCCYYFASSVKCSVWKVIFRLFVFVFYFSIYIAIIYCIQRSCLLVHLALKTRTSTRIVCHHNNIQHPGANFLLSTVFLRKIFFSGAAYFCSVYFTSLILIPHLVAVCYFPFYSFHLCQKDARMN